MTGPLLARIQKLVVKHFTLEIQNLFTKATTFTPIFWLLLVMLESYLEALCVLCIGEIITINYKGPTFFFKFHKIKLWFFSFPI